MGDESTYVLQEKGLWPLNLNNLLHFEKKRTSSIGKTLLMAGLTKGLAWKASAQDVKIWDSSFGVYRRDITLEVLIVIYE
jgi:hypothetical protein